jgi:hypothetical protein
MKADPWTEIWLKWQNQKKYKAALLYEKLGKREHNMRSLGIFTTVSFLKMEPLEITISPDWLEHRRYLR